MVQTKSRYRALSSTYMSSCQVHSHRLPFALKPTASIIARCPSKGNSLFLKLSLLGYTAKDGNGNISLRHGGLQRSTGFPEYQLAPAISPLKTSQKYQQAGRTRESGEPCAFLTIIWLVDAVYSAGNFVAPSTSDTHPIKQAKPEVRMAEDPIYSSTTYHILLLRNRLSDSVEHVEQTQ